jgi:XTP/dITP diphosphohydrolase
MIAEVPAGTEGFGYDPIFLYPPLAVTLAQIPHHQKSRISHRGKAFFALREFLSAKPAL